jgi:hypothetical protein
LLEDKQNLQKKKEPDKLNVVSHTTLDVIEEIICNMPIDDLPIRTQSSKEINKLLNSKRLLNKLP